MALGPKYFVGPHYTYFILWCISIYNTINRPSCSHHTKIFKKMIVCILCITHDGLRDYTLLFSLDFNLANSETIHLKSMLFVKSASKRDKSHSLSWPTVERSWFITLFSTENGQHSKRSLSFRASDGQCKVNSDIYFQFIFFYWTGT